MLNRWTDHKRKLQVLGQSIDKSVRVHTKDNGFSYFLAWLVFLFTFGGMSRKTFLERFATTIGPFQFYPKEWSYESVERVIVHESRHTRQARWFGLGIHPLLGLPVFGILYLLLFLPLGLSFFRALFERDAMRFELKWHYTKGKMNATQLRARAERFGRTVCSGNYGWALPRAWGLPWFKGVAEDIIKETA